MKQKISAVLIAAVLLSGCASRSVTEYTQMDQNQNDIVKATEEQTVTSGATAPEVFYEAKVVPLAIPNHYSDTISYKLIYTTCQMPVFVNDRVIVPVFRKYKDLGSVDELYWGEYYSFYDMSWPVYDLEGNYLFDLCEYCYLPEDALFGVDGDGRIIAVYSEYTCDDETEMEGSFVYSVVFGKDGTIIQYPVCIWKEEDFYINGFLITDDGRYVLSTWDRIIVLEADGTLYGEVYIDDSEQCLGVFEENGKYYVEFAVSDSAQVPATIDEPVTSSELASFSLGEDGELSIGADRMQTDNLAGMKLFQTESGLYAATKNALGKLDLKTGEFSRLLDWNQTDIDRGMLTRGNVRVLEEGELSQTLKLIPSSEEPVVDVSESPEVTVESDVLTTNEGTQTRLLIATTRHGVNGDTPYLVTLYPSDHNPHEGQNIIWVGGVDVSSSILTTYIEAYNQNPANPSWVKIYDYSDFRISPTLDNELYMPIVNGSVERARQEARETMAAQIRSGVGPDIIIGDGNDIDFDNNSCLTNLNGYMDGKNGIDRSLYFDRVFRAFETNGKTYQIPLCFSIYAMLGNKAYTDGKQQMNYQDLSSARVFLPDLATLFVYYPTDILVSLFTAGETNTWIDYENAGMSIDQNSLINMLELLRIHTLTVDEFTIGGYSYRYKPEIKDSLYSVYSGDTAFAIGRFSSLLEFSLSHITSGLTQWYGIPGSRGCTPVIDAEMTAGIASYSVQKEAAWDVIRYLLSEEVQLQIANDKKAGNGDGTLESRIPVLADAFYQTSWTRNDGANYYYTTLPDSDGLTLLGNLDTIFEEFKTWIDQPLRRYVNDPEVISIMLQETESYIEGERQVTEAAEIIQRRIANEVIH